MHRSAALLTGFVLVCIALLGRAQPASAPDELHRAAASVESPQPGRRPADAAVSGAVAVPLASPEAVRYYRTGNMLWIGATLWSLLVPAVLFFGGFSARLRDWAVRWGRYWYPSLVLYVAVFTLILFAADLILDFYAGFVRPHDYGLSSQTLGKWLRDEAIGLGLGLLAGALVAWVPYLLLKHATRRWWLYTWFASIPLMLFVSFVEPIWIEPLFDHVGPMHDKALERRILDLAQRAGIEGANVYEVDKSVDTNQLNAYATGIGATKRIVLWDTLIKQATPDELIVVMGHEMGHYVLSHVWRGLIFGSAVLFAALWLLQRCAGWLLRRFAARTGVGELGDIASLPLLLLILGVFTLAFQPVPLAYSRHLEHEADRFGLEITHDNHACATAFDKFVQHDLAYPTPGPLYVLWRSSHPPLGERIEFCNSYHPWSEGQPGRYSAYFQPPGPADSGREVP